MDATVVVFAGGSRPAGDVLAFVPPAAPVVAADGGADHALELGLAVDLLVGDLDSISAPGLAAIERAGVRIERHPAAKDATDLELALDAALRLGPRRLLVVGGDGGRLDHLLGELTLLGSEAYAGVEVDALLGPARVHVVRGERTLAGRPGESVSLVALHGAARGIVTDGLAYALRGETLEPGSSRGISNAFAAPAASIALAAGVLLAIRPGC
ncbi:MAG: thiamine diphosphokinase [Gaiellaceae bacterium]